MSHTLSRILSCTLSRTLGHTLGLVAAFAAIVTLTCCQAPPSGGEKAVPTHAPPKLMKHTVSEAREIAEFVFVGTVQRVGETSLAEVGKSENMMVVRIDNVLTVPVAVPLRPNDKVTVAVIQPSAFAVGTQAVFYAKGWLYGSGVALIELAHEDPQPAAALTQARLDIHDARFAARIRSSDMVVLGTVQETRAAPAEGGKKRITEHDPMWKEAVVKVTTGIKGATANEIIVVRFPASMDVAWYRAPKLKKGQKATLFMKRDQVTNLAPATFDGNKVRSFTALSPEDVMGAAAAERVQAVARKMPN